MLFKTIQAARGCTRQEINAQGCWYHRMVKRVSSLIEEVETKDLQLDPMEILGLQATMFSGTILIRRAKVLKYTDYSESPLRFSMKTSE